MKDDKKENIDKIEEAIKKKKTLPDEIKNKIKIKLFRNYILAIVIMLYFYFINLGFINIEQASYIVYLKIFTVGLFATTVVIFEIAYKHDNGEIAIFGIETAILAIATLGSVYACVGIPDKYILIYVILSYVFASYYIIKNVIIHRKMKKEYFLGEMKELTKK